MLWVRICSTFLHLFVLLEVPSGGILWLLVVMAVPLDCFVSVIAVRWYRTFIRMKTYACKGELVLLTRKSSIQTFLCGWRNALPPFSVYVVCEFRSHLQWIQRISSILVWFINGVFWMRCQYLLYFYLLLQLRRWTYWLKPSFDHVLHIMPAYYWG